jgi:hypothetical protein
LAGLSAELLSQRRPGPDGLVERYRSSALALGYELRGGDVLAAALCRDLRNLFGSSWLQERSCDFKADSNAWPCRLLRPGTQTASPTFKHLLLQTFLSLAKPGQKEHNLAKPGKATRDYAALDKELATRVQLNLAALVRSGARVPVRDLFTDSELWATWRHDRGLFPTTTTVVDSYRTTAIAERQAGGRPRVYKKSASGEAPAPTAGDDVLEVRVHVCSRPGPVPAEELSK